MLAGDSGAAMSDDKFAVFREQSQSLLTVAEAQEVKGALERFLKGKDVEGLVADLDGILDSPDKRTLVPTIATLIPGQCQADFVQMIASGGALADDGDELPECLHPDFLGMTEKPAQPTEEMHPFDLAMAMAEADISVDPSVFAAAQGGGRGVSSPSRGSGRGLPGGAILNEHDIGDARLEWVNADVVYDCDSRGEAHKCLSEAGMGAGSFLFRPKDLTAPGTSIKLKPGQKPPYRTWALSFVAPDGQVQHQLVEQQNKGDELFIGSKPTGTYELLDLVVVLKEHSSYFLTRPVFHCQKWYHGNTPREVAEAKIRAVGEDGTFLVRKSVKQNKTFFVVSVLNDDHVHHNKLVEEDGRWSTNMSRFTFPTVGHLIENHCEEARGFQHRLTHAVEREEAPKKRRGFRAGGLSSKLAEVPES